MAKFKLITSYDGSDFMGWQRQPDLRTVQGVIENTLRKILNDNSIAICGSGRTDRGVHALGQTAHFFAPDKAKNIDLKRSLNCLLPSDISILNLVEVPDTFHAIASAKKKTYIYKVRNSALQQPIGRAYEHWYPWSLDINLLNEWAQEFIGEQDFQSFQTTGTEVHTTVRTVFESHWVQTGELFEYKVTGSGFLKQMVRNMVGTMLKMAEKNLKVIDLKKIIESRDRSQSFESAPAQGLFLYKVEY